MDEGDICFTDSIINKKNSHHPLQIQIKCLYLQSCSKNRPTNLGEVVEWSITAVLKTVELKGSGGSNPSLSANNLKLSAKRWAFFVQGRQELAPVRTCAGKAQRPQGRELQIVCKGPAASGKGCGARSAANPTEREGFLQGPPQRAEREPAKERSDCANPSLSDE